MPVYAVTKPGGTTDAEFQSYIELLEAFGIDVTDAPRVPEPGTDHRWLYVWQRRDQAARFARELGVQTYDRSWEVREFEPLSDHRGPLAPVEILVIPTPDGTVFRLTQRSLIRISEHYPNARLVGELSRRSSEAHRVPVFLWPTKTRADFERKHGPVWEQVVMILSGLPIETIDRIGGYRFVDARGETLHESAPSLDATPNPR